jgi:hypothetical protein
MKKLLRRVGTGLALLPFSVSLAFAQTAPSSSFPVNTGAIDGMKSDIIAWGGALLAIGIAFLAYRVVRRVVGG